MKFLKRSNPFYGMCGIITTLSPLDRELIIHKIWLHVEEFQCCGMRCGFITMGYEGLVVCMTLLGIPSLWGAKGWLRGGSLRILKLLL